MRFFNWDRQQPLAPPWRCEFSIVYYNIAYKEPVDHVQLLYANELVQL